MVNLGLVPCFWVALRKPKWAVLAAALFVALLLTESKAGLLAAFVACYILSWHRFGETFAVLGLTASLHYELEQLASPVRASNSWRSWRPYLGPSLNSASSAWRTLTTFLHSDTY